jgi:branched-chain amino acid transport system substrate-binding protein
MITKKFGVSALAALALATFAGPALAENAPGVTDTEIKIGNTNPYSGPASAYGVIGKTIAAYFKEVNDKGGINGRKINFISYDDAYSPPKTVEQTRKLVESDEVAFLFQTLGTAANMAIVKYTNSKKVPQLFVATGATAFGDHEKFPWTMGFNPSYQVEGQIYGKYLVKNHPDAKIAVLFQNDDYGKDLLKGLKTGLGAKASNIVAETSYEVTAPTIASEIVNLKASGAEVFVNIATPKFAAQAIAKIAELGWKPIHILNNVSVSIGSVLKPAGLENAKGVISTGYLKDSTDKQWDNDPATVEWKAFMNRSLPGTDLANSTLTYAYTAAQLLEIVLKNCGNDLSRENILKQAASLKDIELGLILPGIKINTGPKDHYPFEQLQMMKFNGTTFEFFGEVIDGKVGS